MASAALGPARRRLLAPPPLPSSSICAAAAAAAAARRHYSFPSYKKYSRLVELSNRHVTGPDKLLREMREDVEAQAFKDGNGRLFPCTFVAMPLSQCPRHPVCFFEYQWARLKRRLADTIAVVSMRLQSMPSFTSAPRWKVRRRRIAPTATAMYRDVLEAFARGDKQALSQLCTGSCAAKFAAAVDRRDPATGWRFEVVKYNRRFLYPRLKSHRIQDLGAVNSSCFNEQAVVAICSTQRASKYKVATSETIPGSLRLQDKIEYVVLMREVDKKTYVGHPWRIWGTIEPTNLEAYSKELAFMERENARMLGL